MVIIGRNPTKVESGEKFGFWEIIEEAKPKIRVDSNGKVRKDRIFKCLCTNCNKTIKGVELYHLKSVDNNKCQSCATAIKNIGNTYHKIHGYSASHPGFYKSWLDARRRKGFTKESGWENIHKFAEDMLDTWFKHAHLGRYNPKTDKYDTGQYGLGLCRWITLKQNRREQCIR